MCIVWHPINLLHHGPLQRFEASTSLTRKGTGRVLGQEALIEIWIVSEARFVPGQGVRRPGTLQRIGPSTPRQTREQHQDTEEEPQRCPFSPHELVWHHRMSSAMMHG